MKKSLLCFFSFVLLVIALPLPATAAAVPDFVSLSQQIKPSVVNISTSKTVRPKRPMLPGPRSPYKDFFDDFFEHFFEGHPGVTRKESSLGSGLIISEDGYILTNDHVVSNADEIQVRLADGRTLNASIKGLDPKLDLALLKIDAAERLSPARLGDSDNLKVGEWVMAIGNPFGLKQTVTVGIVSAKDRVIGAGPYDDFIQTDASINPGNSGGPLVNTDGEVVGINTAIIAGGQGIGFAIPINAAKSILPQLKKTGYVTRGWLGVTVQQLSEELAESFGLKEPKGALVSEVANGSPAEKAGIKRGDIIFSFDGEDIVTMNDLPRLVAATPVNKTIELVVFRNGRTLKFSVKVGKLEEPERKVAAGPAGSLGLTVSDVSAEAVRIYSLESDKGALVTAVDPLGPATESGLRSGDLILEVNGRETADASAFRTVLAQAEKGEVLRLLIQRGKSLFYTTLKVA
jgi:serine protease Do